MWNYKLLHIRILDRFSWNIESAYATTLKIQEKKKKKDKLKTIELENVLNLNLLEN